MFGPIQQTTWLQFCLSSTPNPPTSKSSTTNPPTSKHSCQFTQGTGNAKMVRCWTSHEVLFFISAALANGKHTFPSSCSTYTTRFGSWSLLWPVDFHIWPHSINKKSVWLQFCVSSTPNPLTSKPSTPNPPTSKHNCQFTQGKGSAKWCGVVPHMKCCSS